MATLSKERLIAKYGSIDRAKLAMRYELHLRKQQVPSQFFIPNRGQDKLFKVLERDKLPMVTGFLAGNGVGKTCTLVQVMTMIGWGKEILNPKHLGMNKFVDKFCYPRRKLRARLVCHSDDMKDGGSLYDEIIKSFPKGRYTMSKEGKTHVVIIRCDTGVSFSVRTFDQATEAHAGSNLDIILCNEPMPERLHGENIGRLRDSKVGMLLYFMTPLGVSAWLYDQVVEADDGENTVVVYASIWDNCKDIPGTNGILRKEKIDLMIREWMIQDPEEADARITGKFKHLSGRIYKVYSDEAHKIPRFDIPKDWRIYRILDPHDKRPPAVQWWAVDPLNRAYCVDEYPQVSADGHGEYHKINDTKHTYDHFATEIKKIDAKYGKIDYEFMDPNKGNSGTRHKDQTICEVYNSKGFNFKTKVNDDLDFGHKEIQSLLYFDNNRPIDDFNQPQMFFFEDCRNSVNAVRKYGWKSKGHGSSTTSKVDQTYKDFADTLRYFGVSMKPWKKRTKNSALSSVLRSKRGRN